MHDATGGAIVSRMERWNIPTVEAAGRREPRVLFSTPECRAVVIDLRAGEQLGEHSVRERAVVEVVSGEVDVRAESGSATCGPGTLMTFAPEERHAISARGDARLLLMLSPWPGEGHYPVGADVDARRTSARASAAPEA
jgi:quercetin dioxygenase-like cupin family protein